MTSKITLGWIRSFMEEIRQRKFGNIYQNKMRYLDVFYHNLVSQFNTQCVLILLHTVYFLTENIYFMLHGLILLGIMAMTFLSVNNRLGRKTIGHIFLFFESFFFFKFFVWTKVHFVELHGPKVPCCCRLHTHRCRASRT